MSNFNHIQEKLKEFIKKYYLNELIKGTILFFAFGLLYLMCTLFIEYFLWLKPLARTLLFWVFIAVELSLLTKYIFIPVFKLIGINKGISLEEASEIIGKHFKEVDDKLLNVLQLQTTSDQSELLLASIEQKSVELVPIPFKKAVNFSRNKTYLKYLLVPLIVFGFIYVSGNLNLFSESYERVVHHQTYFEPPAPFSFAVLNDKLEVVEGKSITISINVSGKVLPENVNINFLDQTAFTKNVSQGLFEYTFSSVQDDLTFFIESNGIISKEYAIKIIPAPVITNFEMWLDYPGYTGKKDELLENTGNAIVPQGTSITWKLKSKNTSKITFNTSEITDFKKVSNDFYELEKRVFKKFSYEVSSSNRFLQNFESLKYSIDVLKDEVPKIEVRSNIDSISYGPVQFAGQLSDDYGLDKLVMVYYDKKTPVNFKEYEIAIGKLTFEEFYYIFPKGISLKEGVDYELYFEVFDNDGVNGTKSVKSNVFSYYKKTESELEEQLLEEQQKSIDNLEDSVEKNKETKEQLEQFQESLQHKSEMNWNDQQKLENFMKRQEQYENMMQVQTKQIHQSLEEQPISENKDLEERKKDIQQRLKEAEELAKQEALRDELKELAEKLDKEELTEKLKRLTEKNRQNERSLERILELTKRFYVEQKANQISEKLEELSKKQEGLSEDKENSSERQRKLNSEYDDLEKSLEDLDKENQNLQRPMNLPNSDKQGSAVKEDMKEATKKLEESEFDAEEKDDGDNQQKEESKKSAKSKQKSAAQKMKQMSQMLQQSMQAMQGETMDEDIEMLRAILENLLEYSFQQEDLMNEFSETTNTHPEFSSNLKKQQVLREYFEHIDDSIYTLSMRQPKIGTQIFKSLGDAHFYLDQSLIHFADNQFNVGLADQQFVMTATNDIAYLLSTILNGMQNSSSSMGQGQGEGDPFSLPDIIKKQSEAIEEMKEGMEKGKKSGEEDGNDGENKKGIGGKESEGDENTSGELFEIYKQQSELRKMLEEVLGDKKNAQGEGVGENALKQMELLERELLEKGFTEEVFQKMMLLKHELLKLDEAGYVQGQESKRESKNALKRFENREIKDIEKEKLWFEENEILIRQTLPLHLIYKKRVQEYFKKNDSI